MKKETLAKRIAEKSNCPELEPYVLGLTGPETLPTDCLVWRGKRLGIEIRPRLTRVGFELRMRTPPQVCRIRFEGKEHQVNRLIEMLRENPSETFRMRKRCHTPFCMNPLHWETVIKKPQPVEDSTVMEAEEWTPQDVEEMLEILFTEHTPTSWDEIINAPLMESAPAELIIPVLTRWNKNHLLP